MVLVLSLAAPWTATRADAIAREEALHRLIQRTEMPMSTAVMARLMADLRRVVPAAFVTQAGAAAKLGDRWQPGTPRWDRARLLVDEAIAREESVGGPVFAVTSLDVERALDVPWTEDDIAFLDASLDTPIGRAVLKLLDAAIVSGFATNAARQPGVPADTVAAFDGLAAEGRTSFGEALTEVARRTEEDRDRSRRLQELVAVQDASRGRQLGTSLIAPSMRRFSSVASAVAPQVEHLVDEARASP